MYPSIPSIDFSGFHGSVRDRQQVASEIDNALSTIGFFYLINHGIEQHKIDAYFEWVSLIIHPLLTSCDQPEVLE
jgi:isopenicillin N synthase-like dioxygenase